MGIEPTPKSSMYTCEGCGLQAAVMLQCGICKVVRYCDKTCQRKDWKLTHKKKCKRTLTMDTSIQSIYFNKAFPHKHDKQACWLYASQSNHTAMFMIATKQAIARPFPRLEDPSRTVADFIKDKDWHGWYKHEKNHFQSIMQGRIIERDSCVRRKDWRGWLGAAVAEQAMANCQAVMDNLLSAMSRCNKAAKYISMAMADENYKENKIETADRMDIEGTFFGIESMRQNFECLVLKAENLSRFKSLRETVSYYGHESGMAFANASVSLIAGFEKEAKLWEKSNSFSNVYQCEIYIVDLYHNMATYKSSKYQTEVFDVSKPLSFHLDKAAGIALIHRNDKDMENIVLDLEPLVASLLCIISNRRVHKTKMLPVPVFQDV